MHILLIHQAFAALDEPGGTRHHELARYLANQGHRFTIIASPVSYLTGATHATHTSWCQRQDGGPGVEILRAYTYSALHRSFLHRVVSFVSFMISSFVIGLQVKDVDLVWGTSPPIFQGLTAWALARLRRIPFLFEVRDLWPAFAVAVGVLRQPILIRLSEWLERFLYRHADRVMVNSPGFIEHVRHCGARQIELVPNGADPEMFDPLASGDVFRQAHGLQGKFVVLYAGAHGMSNDLGTALQAAQRLRYRTEIVFVFMGAGKDKPVLMARSQEMELDNVMFVGPAPKNEIAAALAAADACLAILRPIELYKTVYPNKVFDYMAAGRPVILAIDGVIREVVEAAGAGRFVSPGDPAALAQAVLALSDDPALARSLGTAGRRYIESCFSRPLLAEQLRRLIEEMGA
jgi:glycosyltransferase involved in cell wall biosynthesis